MAYAKIITHRCEPVARAGIDQGDEILVDVPHNGITEKEDRLIPKNTDRVGPFEEVRHGDWGARGRAELDSAETQHRMELNLGKLQSNFHFQNVEFEIRNLFSELEQCA